MTVTVTVTPPKTLTRGWSGDITLTMTNTGDENIQNLFVKINSTAGAIFSVFKALCAGNWVDILNTYSIYRLDLDSDVILPAGGSRTFQIRITVKSDATLGATSLTWSIQYEVY